MSAPKVLPTRLRPIVRRFGQQPIALLDVGSGSHSASITKRWLPNSVYHGIDCTRDYANDESDFRAMDRFFELDLTTLAFDDIADDSYDVLMMSHVIEHLPNGDLVLERLLPKVRRGGVVYVEFPGERSTRLPSKQGTLNFYDDSTHCRIFSVEEVSKVLDRGGFTVLRAGRRRDWRLIALMPAFMVKSRLTWGYVPGSVYWDLLGFADFVYAERP